MRSDRWAFGGVLAAVAALGVGGVSALVGDHAGATTLWVILGMGAVGVVLAARASSLAVAVAGLLAVLEVRDAAPYGTWAVAGGLLFLFALRRPRFNAVTAGVLIAASAKTHVNRAMSKMHVRSREQLVVAALRADLPDD